jgi:lysophospholipase L1-like esterase
MRDSLASTGGLVTVVMFPYGHQYRFDLLLRDENYVLKPQRLMKQICAELDVPLLDLYPVLEEHGGRKLLPDGIHLSPEGHQIASEAIVDHLERSGLVAGSQTEPRL